MSNINGSLKNKTFSNMLWRFAERFGAEGVKFLVSIILARLLMPEEYGTLALIMVFISILNVFIDSGLGNALIQKKDADDLDFSTVFLFNLFFCVILYLVMFFLAPYIALFYRNETLTPVIRVLCLTLIISGVKNVQQAYVSRNLLFKKFFFATLGGTLGAAILGIIMAYNGYGVWALIAQHLFNTTTDTIILWISVKWKPKFTFSFSRFKKLFSYGWKLLIASLISNIYINLRQLLIGRVYSSSDLAFYNKGKEFPNTLMVNIDAATEGVLFPVFSQKQDDLIQLKNMLRKSIMAGCYILFPVMAGLAAIGKNMIPLLLTEKWLPALPFLYIFCFSCALDPISSANLNGLRAMGRSDKILKLEIIKKSIGLCLVLISIPFGVFTIALTAALYSVIAQIINSIPNSKILNYSIIDQFKDLLPSLGISLLMFVIVYVMNSIPMNRVLLLVIQIITGFVVYVLFSAVFRLESFMYMKDILLGFIKFKKEMK